VAWSILFTSNDKHEVSDNNDINTHSKYYDNYRSNNQKVTKQNPYTLVYEGAGTKNVNGKAVVKRKRI